MIPLRDTIRTRSFPLINLLLIAANALVFLYEVSLPPNELDRFIFTFGMVPDRLNLTDPVALALNPAPLITLFSHMFMHGGWFHLISNMWVLYIFGDNIEDRMGAGRYFVFYILCGLASALLQAFVAPSSRVPAVGASGAIAGILGAYFILYPAGRVLTLIPIFIIPWFVEIPSVVFLGFWFVSQLFSGLAALNVPNASNMGGVAWWAHIGGFIFGVLVHRFFIRHVHPSYYRDYPRFPDDTI